jgi:hypothetical protein
VTDSPANLTYTRDGNQWRCTRPDFKNLQESPAGFGDTKDDARKALEMDGKKFEQKNKQGV